MTISVGGTVSLRKNIEVDGRVVVAGTVCIVRAIYPGDDDELAVVPASQPLSRFIVLRDEVEEA